MKAKANPQKCMINYEQAIQRTVAEMMDFRKRSKTKDIYLFMIRFKLFAELQALTLAWKDISRCFTSGEKIADLRVAYDHVNTQIFLPRRAAAGASDPGNGDVKALFDAEPKIGSVNFSRLRELADQAASGDNRAAEELEFCIVARSPLTPLTLSWAALGLTGIPKAHAFFNVVEFIPCDDQGFFREQWLDSFDEFFKCVETAVNMTVGGSNNKRGLYHSLPPLW